MGTQPVAYSDIPQGATLVTPTNYSDVPKGAQIVAHGAAPITSSLVVEPQKGLLHRAWDAVSTPLITPESFMPGGKPDTSVSDSQIAAGHPIRAGLAKFGEGVNDSLAKLFSSLTSPVGLATAVGTAGEGTAAKALGSGASLLFGAQGAKQALTPRQPGENTPDMLERRLGGAGQGMLGVAGEASYSKGAVGNVAREMSGIGPSMENLKAYLHKSATEKIQPFVQKVEEGAHQEASTNAQNLATHMDAAKPEGYFPKQELQAMVKDKMGDIVKIPSKTPNSISALLGETNAAKPAEGVRALSNSELRAADVIKKSGLTGNDARSMAQNLGFTNRQVDGIMQSVEGANTAAPKYSDALTFNQLWQHTSALGRELNSLRGKGPVEAGAKAVYSELQDKMRAAAESQGKGDEWQDVRKGWRDYINFRNMSQDAREGQNSSDITKPFLGKNAVPMKQQMSQYARFAPGELSKFTEEVNKHNVGKTVQNISQPRRMDFTIAAISPKLAALKQGIARGMRSPSTIEAITGKGLPDIDKAKVLAKRP
jgi:hypothetical protein